MMLMRKVTAELHVEKVLAVSVALVAVVLLIEVAHRKEADALLSVFMAMMLVVVVEVVARLTARSLVIMTTTAIGVS